MLSFMRNFFRTLLVLIIVVNYTGCTIIEGSKWPGESNTIILTFDDGPSTEVSDALLDVLDKHHIHASFSYIGKNIEKAPSIAKRAVDSGHEVIFHTHSHTVDVLMSKDRVLDEFEQYQNALDDAVGQQTNIRLIRPPLGLKTPAMMSANKQLQLEEAYITFFVNDAKTGPENYDKVMEKIKKRLIKKGGGAIVLHEMRYKADRDPYEISKSWLPEAVDELIIWARQAGFDFAQYR
jgi:peptidoglycan/xylan/chitin deacetylase (PgdA/CDA1 family)